MYSQQQQDLKLKHNHGPPGLRPSPHSVVHHPPLVTLTSPTPPVLEVEWNNCSTQTTTELLPSLIVVAMSCPLF